MENSNRDDEVLLVKSHDERCWNFAVAMKNSHVIQIGTEK